MVTTNQEHQDDALTDKVREAVARGVDVRETVHRLTLDALSHQTQGMASLGRIVSAVARGARDGVQEELHDATVQAQAARTHVQEAITGLDAALAQFVEASKLAVEEAAGRAQRFSSEELARVHADLQSLESLLLDTLNTSATTTRGLAAEIFHDLVEHARRSGTAVGEQVNATLASFTRQMAETGKQQMEAGAQLARATADTLRKIAAGMLSGLATRVQPEATADKPGKTPKSAAKPD
jgi:post-segregation antitoxin (ccd killing protein)